MHLEGSCYCGAVGFSVEAAAPAPFLRCYCSICRKTGGGGGYAINLGAQAAKLKVRGVDHITVRSPAERRFCSRCGSALWVWDPRWPELVHPFAGAIDTPLPVAPEQVHMMLDAKPAWVRLDAKRGEARFDDYPAESLDDWHRRHGLLDPV